jgi:hypothetical protein
VLNYIVAINWISSVFAGSSAPAAFICNTLSRTNSLQPIEHHRTQDIDMNTLPLHWIIAARVVVIAFVALMAWFFYKLKKQSARL